MRNVKTIETDVLVIGGGGAGFRAAIGAREKGCNVLMISKGPLARCGATPMAGADYTLDGKSMSKIEGLTGDPNDSAWGASPIPEPGTAALLGLGLIGLVGAGRRTHR